MDVENYGGVENTLTTVGKTHKNEDCRTITLTATVSGDGLPIVIYNKLVKLKC